MHMNRRNSSTAETAATSPLERAIRQTSDRVESDVFTRRGVRQLRVLSESKFQALLEELIAERLPAKREASRSEIDALRKRCMERLESHRDEQWRKIGALEDRLESVRGTFDRLEQAMERLVEAVETSNEAPIEIVPVKTEGRTHIAR